MRKHQVEFNALTRNVQKRGWVWEKSKRQQKLQHQKIICHDHLTPKGNKFENYFYTE